MRVYLAGRFARREEFRDYEKLLLDNDIECCSGWLHSEEPDEDQGGARALTDEERAHFAVEDMQDVAKCDVLIAFTEEPGVTGGARGGRHVEFGAAIAMEKEVLIVGPRENLFHWLPGLKVFESFRDALKYLEKYNG